MSKLSLDALKQRADAVASEELMSQISGGTDNDCHDTNDELNPADEEIRDFPADNTNPDNWGDGID